MASKIQGDPEAALRSLIAECPMISDYLKDAQRITTGQYGQLRIRKDYSYHNTKFWCPGMVLIGDAACFVDPVFSTGVHLATYSASAFAARSINSVLDWRSSTSSERLGNLESRYRREFSVFYEYLMCFYDMHVSEDSYYWSAKKVTKDTNPELEAFVDLVGGISSRRNRPGKRRNSGGTFLVTIERICRRGAGNGGEPGAKHAAAVQFRGRSAGNH